MGLFDDLFVAKSVSEDEYNDQDREAEEIRLRNLGLTDEEIRLVIEEGWDETSFEDDEDADKEDDDYYGEDF